MPNQLSSAKKRKTVAEHAAVLALLDQIAETEGGTSTDLMRQAARELVSRHAKHPVLTEQLRATFLSHSPKAPKRFKSPAQLSRYKKALREYDAIAIELGLANPHEVQTRNSIHRSPLRPALAENL